MECQVSWEAIDPPHTHRSSFPTNHIPNQHIHQTFTTMSVGPLDLRRLLFLGPRHPSSLCYGP